MYPTYPYKLGGLTINFTQICPDVMQNETSSLLNLKFFNNDEYNKLSKELLNWLELQLAQSEKIIKEKLYLETPIYPCKTIKNIPKEFSIDYRLIDTDKFDFSDKEHLTFLLLHNTIEFF